MIVTDMSGAKQFAPLAQALEDRLTALIKAQAAYFEKQPPSPDGFDIEDDYDHPSAVYEQRGNDIFYYLFRRAERPLVNALRNRYEQLWGKKKSLSYSYFMPEQTLKPIWRRAWARAKN